MKTLQIQEILQYVEINIDKFHNIKLQRLNDLKLINVLKKKNPYLYKAKNVRTSEQIVRSIVDAYISSQEETIFGNWLEGLAIFINQKIYNGRKSGITGIDLEFDRDNIRFIVNIKSGPNWGNASQISKMKSDFNTAKKTLRTSYSQMNIIAVNGCCYGKDNKSDKGDYFKYCGQEFWEFISGNPNLYLEIIEPLGFQALKRNENYAECYDEIINKFSNEFSREFCLENGKINWEKIVIQNSKKK